MRRLRDDVQGSVAIEFSIIGSVALLLLLGSMQVGLYFYTSAALDAATAKAMRQVRTGAVGASTLTAAQFRTNVLCPLLPSTMSCSDIVTNIQIVPQASSPDGFYRFVNSDQSGIVKPTMDNSVTAFCTGKSGSVVYAQIYYAMPIVLLSILKLPAAVWNGRSVFFVGSYAAFKNEPFQSASGGC